MPSSRASFAIEIKTSADLEGAKASLAALEGQRDALKAMGKDSAEVEDHILKLQRAMVSAELKKITGQTEDAAEGLHKFGNASGEAEEKADAFNKHGIHAMAHALNEAFPGLTQFARFLTSGFTAAIGAALVAFEYLKEKIEEVDKTLDALNTGPGARGEWADDIKKQTEEADVAVDVFADHLERVITLQESLSAATDRALALQKEAMAAAGDEAAAQTELRKAQVDLAEKLGRITPEQAIKIKLEIDDAEFKRQLEAKVAGIQAELDARKKEQQTNDDALGTADRPGPLQVKYMKAEAEKRAADNAKTQNEDKLKKDKEDAENIQKVNEEGSKQLDALYAGWQTPAAKMQEAIIEGMMRKNEELLAKTETLIHKETAKQQPLDAAAAKADAAFQEAKTQIEDAAKNAADLRTKIDDLEAQLAGAKAHAGKMESIHDQTSATRAQGEIHEELDRARGRPQEALRPLSNKPNLTAGEAGRLRTSAAPRRILTASASLIKHAIWKQACADNPTRPLPVTCKK